MVDPHPGVPTRLSGGTYLAVLALDLSEELLDNPAAWAETCPADDEDGTAESQ